MGRVLEEARVTVMALILILNITYMIIIVIESRMDKKRAEARMKRLHYMVKTSLNQQSNWRKEW